MTTTMNDRSNRRSVTFPDSIPRAIIDTASADWAGSVDWVDWAVAARTTTTRTTTTSPSPPLTPRAAKSYVARAATRAVDDPTTVESQHHHHQQHQREQQPWENRTTCPINAPPPDRETTSDRPHALAEAPPTTAPTMAPTMAVEAPPEPDRDPRRGLDRVPVPRRASGRPLAPAEETKKKTTRRRKGGGGDLPRALVVVVSNSSNNNNNNNILCQRRDNRSINRRVSLRIKCPTSTTNRKMPSRSSGRMLLPPSLGRRPILPRTRTIPRRYTPI